MIARKLHRRIGWWMAMSLGVLMLGGCTHAPTDSHATPDRDPDEIATENDPFEPLNRGIYQFNYTVDGLVLKPVTSVYRGVMPEKGRLMVSNTLDNIYMPLTFFNSVLQGDPENSFTSLWSFLLNSTVGIGGLFDVASDAGLHPRRADLGQTFALYGAGTGPYVVIPIIGPSNTRDAFGRLGDAFMNPFNYVDTGASITLWTATAIDQRSRNTKLLDTVYGSSLDPYATFRSGYTQKRAEDIRRAKAARDKALEKAGKQCQ